MHDLLVKPASDSAMLRLGWQKVASVTPGGRPYFWHRKAPDGQLQWVVWDRGLSAWILRTEDDRS